VTGLLNWRRLVAVVVLTIGVAIALAVASGGRAGSVAPGTLKAAVEPQFLTAGEDGVTFGKFMAPSGAGTGSATNSSMIFDVDNGLLEQNSPVCVRAASSPTPGFTRWTCALGTINAGQSAGAFVNFRGPAFLPSPATNIYTVKAFFTADTGKSTKGGGGQNSTPVVVDTTQIVDVPNGRRAGNCTGTAATPAGDPQFTTLTGIPAASIATCPWVFVGEDDAPAGSEIRSQISFWGFPLTEPGHPARWVMDGDLPSGPFNKLTLYYLANYSPDNPDTGKVPFPACVNGAIVAPATACYDTFTKVGSRFHAEGFVNGTGGDPGAGVG
jgi:hypothetical protein